MTIRKSTLLLNSLMAMAVLLTSVMLYHLNQSIDALQQIQEKRNITLQLGEELRDSSKNLTSNVRIYAVTSAPQALNRYQQIVNIRAGKEARPSDADIAPGQKIALLELMKLHGVQPAEYALVEEANRLSNALIILETEAMNAVQGLYKDSAGNFTIKKAPDKDYAESLVFGPAYTEETLKIMRPIDRFVEMLQERTNAEVLAERNNATHNLVIVGLCLCFVLLAVLCSAWYTQTSVASPLRATTLFAQKVAAGNLSESIAVHSNNEIGILRRTLNSMVENLKTQMHNIEEKSRQAQLKEKEALASKSRADEALVRAEEAARNMREVAGQLENVVSVLSSASEDLSTQITESEEGAEEQAARVSETVASVERMSETTATLARNADHAADVTRDARTRADRGADTLERATASIAQMQETAIKLKADMSRLGEQVQGISRVMNVINDIADQTNLLALNAAIEAARAGEAGRGFAVVADEVRKLAEKTMQSTAEVGAAVRSIEEGARTNMANVDSSAQAVNQAADLARESGSTFREIVDLVVAINEEMDQITQAAQEQNVSGESIQSSIQLISRISGDTLNRMREASRAVESLSGEVLQLTRLTKELGS